MKLFHYHHWTDQVEEMERFYTSCGFRVTQRVGKANGVFSHFDPPLAWDDFRGQRVLFRIIEVVLGSINVTFGFGKGTQFDHLGYLVDETEHVAICERAGHLGWETEIKDRRTFIYTPYSFKIELQRRMDVVDRDGDCEIAHVLMETAHDEIPMKLNELFGGLATGIRFIAGEKTRIQLVEGTSASPIIATDPCGVRLAFSTKGGE